MGLGVAMVTPFDKDGNIDIPALKKLTRHLVDGGTDYLVVQGTTGESPVLSDKEKQLVLDTVIAENAGKIPVVFGIGGNNTAKLVESFSTFNLKGVDGILSASPYYNKPSQEGIYQHYCALAAATKLPIILYNVPGRTSSNILAETTLRLARDVKNIVGVKEASGNLDQMMTIIRNRPKDFLLISGDDSITLPIIAAGGDGVISVVGNAFPREFKALVSAALAGDMAKAREFHYRIFPVIAPLFAEGNPAGIKEILAHLGIMNKKLRLPLVNVSEKLKKELISITDNLLQGAAV
jgi:4-hydroxy-tetrahydrodipicolinate synthase